MPEFPSDLFARLVPDALDAFLARTLSGSFRRQGEGGRFRVTAAGEFRGYLAEDLLALAAHPKAEGALVIVEEESARVLFFDRGVLVGTASNVLFEQLGRVLYKSGVVTQEDADTLIGLEDAEGAASLIGWVPDDVLAWAVAHRARDVVVALPYVARAHFVLVAGKAPLHGLPAPNLDPGDLATEARLLYEAWRDGSAEAGEGISSASDAPAPLPGPLQPPRTREEEIQDILKRVRDADIRLE